MDRTFIIFAIILLSLNESLGEFVNTIAGSIATPTAPTVPRQFIITGRDVALDTAGNYFVADASSVTIVRVSAVDRSIVTYAGGGRSSAEGAVGTDIYFTNIWGQASDTLGKLYYSEYVACRVRVLSPTKVVTTVVGVIGSCGHNGDALPGTSTWLNYPQGIHFDALTNLLYVTDQVNHYIRTVNVSSSSFVTKIFAGGRSGGFVDNVPASSAYFHTPSDVWVNTIQDVFIADAVNCRIRKVTKSTGLVSTIAGSTSCGYSTSTIATTAYLNNPLAVCGDLAGTIYFVQEGHARKVTSAGAISTVAGSSTTALPVLCWNKHNYWFVKWLRCE